jgi:uncharacterized protein YjbI with pentapeptide repeats
LSKCQYHPVDIPSYPGCNEPTITNSNFCFFHDKDHYLEHKPDAKKRIQDKVSVSNKEALNCTGYYVPYVDFAELLEEEGFEQPIYFMNATFYEGANFSFVKFPKSADFSNSTFSDLANFGNTIFSEDVNFEETQFQDVDFNEARFYRDAEFTKARFIGKANFRQVEIWGKTSANFNGAQFQEIDFTLSRFYGEGNFSAHFYRDATFSHVRFYRKADFAPARFDGKADFEYARFYGDADFTNAEFSGKAGLDDTFFYNEAIFHQTQFKEYADFFGSSFYGEAKFTFTSFSQKVRFDEARFVYAKFIDVDFKDEVEFVGVEFPSTDKNYLFDWLFIMSEEGKSRLVEFLNGIFKLGLNRENLRTEWSEQDKTMKISWQAATASSSLSHSVSSLSCKFVLNLEKSLATLTAELPDNKPREFVAMARSGDPSIAIYDKDIAHSRIPIKFRYSTFRKRARFGGEPNKRLDLGFVSFVSVDMANIEFSNVQWKTKKEKLLWVAKVKTRNVIIDEVYLARNNNNYEEVSRIYNQLRKNYEARLLFNEASHFFIGEMEAIRKSLLGKKVWRKLQSIPYWIYKWLALYGESIRLPLVIWTPIIIGIFVVMREAYGICATPDSLCNIGDRLIDSISAYFQFPRSNPMNSLDIIERIVSAPVLGTAFIALRRRFERAK